MSVAKNKKTLKTLFKVILTFTALYVVFAKVSLEDVFQTILHTNLWYLFLAFIFFNLSKITSSIRLNIYFDFIDVPLKNIYALRLYYIGMFYNLFLPSGIGGDGYKIYLLHKSHKNVKVKTLISATFLDRISGLVPLLFFAGVLFFYSGFYSHFFWLDMFVIFATILILPLFYIFSLMFFKRYIAIFFKTLSYGFVVQALQVISAFFIICSIGETSFITFLTLFLISSVLAVLPISIGGVGIREVTFLYGANLLELSSNSGVAIALIFFIITAISSFVGIFLKDEV